MPAPRRPLDRFAIVSAFGCCLLFGLGHVAAKAALPEIPALWQASLRFTGAAVAVLLYSKCVGVGLLSSGRTLSAGLLAGLFFTSEFILIYLGLNYTTASRMTVFSSMAPFVVAIGMPFIHRAESLSHGQWFGLALAFCSIAYCFLDGPAATDNGEMLTGDAMACAAALMWGLTTLTIRGSSLAQLRAEQVLFYQLVVAAVITTVAALALGVPWPTHWSIRAVLLLAYQSMVVTFASYLLWFYLMRHYQANPLSVFALTTPFFAVLGGSVMLHEPISLRLILASAGLLIGIAFVNQTRRPNPKILVTQRANQ